MRGEPRTSLPINSRSAPSSNRRLLRATSREQASSPSRHAGMIRSSPGSWTRSTKELTCYVAIAGLPHQGDHRKPDPATRADGSKEPDGDSAERPKRIDDEVLARECRIKNIGRYRKRDATADRSKTLEHELASLHEQLEDIESKLMPLREITKELSSLLTGHTLDIDEKTACTSRTRVRVTVRRVTFSTGGRAMQAVVRDERGPGSGNPAPGAVRKGRGRRVAGGEARSPGRRRGRGTAPPRR